MNWYALETLVAMRQDEVRAGTTPRPSSWETQRTGDLDVFEVVFYLLMVIAMVLMIFSSHEPIHDHSWIG